MNSRTIFRAIALLALAAVMAGGCSWMGRTAGRAQAKAERNIKAIEEGYHDGYDSERARTETQK